MQIAQAQGRVAACATSVHPWQAVGSAGRQPLSNVSRILHPWRLLDAIRQTSQAVEEQLGAELQAIATLDVLLPLRYGQEHLRRTRHRGPKAQIALVLQAVKEAVERHACPRQLKPEVLAGWKAWVAEHAKAFQRASSAMEGRNGSLSQRQHNHRGLPTRRYQGGTVLHTFDWRAADGTTPASRFCRRSFPDLFERVLAQIDEWPRPKPRRQASAASH